MPAPLSPADLGPTPNRAATAWRDRLNVESTPALLTLEGRLKHINSGSSWNLHLGTSSSSSSMSSNPNLRYGTWRPMTASSALSLPRAFGEHTYGGFAAGSASSALERSPSAFGLVSRRLPLPDDAPTVAQIESRWPGQRWGLGMPLRPSLRVASTQQEGEGMRFFNGVWRPRPETSPRMSPI